MNSRKKQSLQIFAIVFILAYIFINWNDISWLFNYQEMSGIVYDFIYPYQDNNILIASSQQTGISAIQHFVYPDNSTFLEIPSIGVSTPLVFGETTDNTVLENDLNKGAVYYPGSVLPGQQGQSVILGHSAPPGWPRIRHDYIFSDLSNVANGDAVIIHFNNTIYTYTVIGKNIIQQGQDVSLGGIGDSNGTLAIVSCWPPGKNYKRIVVYAQLVKK
jgi:LPXTG-site transpeptidase (sortase) family protein